MARLLYIEASPRKDRSASIEVAKAFIDAYKASHRADVIDTIDLWKTDLPPFDGDTVNAKYSILHGQQKRRHGRRSSGSSLTSNQLISIFFLCPCGILASRTS